jgi:hypothetical protein
VPPPKYDATHGETPERPWGSLLDKYRELGEVPLGEAPRDPARRARHEMKQAGRAQSLTRTIEEDRQVPKWTPAKPQAPDFTGTPAPILPVPEVVDGVRSGVGGVMQKIQEAITGPTGAEPAPPPLVRKPGHGDDEVPPDTGGHKQRWSGPYR